MSEIKGQLLGILLVIAIFAAISTILIGTFRDAANDVKDKISEAITITSE
ncbi:MAG: hypothetical protein WCZ47_04110 [Bacilli bacterium]|jgi:hypothetical protein|nr:hypothetical protein [Erysipelotrichia bacterium]